MTERDGTGMQCKNCKYRMDIGNTKETGSALCSYPESDTTIFISRVSYSGAKVRCIKGRDRRQ